MNSFYSSLVINSKRFPNVFPHIRPRYNREYFRRVTANVAELETLIEQRCKFPDPNLSGDKLKDLRLNSSNLIKLKERLDKLNFENAKYQKTLDELEAIEDRLMPIVVSIPNRTSKLVPPQETIVEELQSDFQARENLVKVLSYRKLSYINNCYSKSVVGPNSHYYFGIGAKLQHGLSSYFTNHLESANFVPVSGLCLTRSAVVEAANSKDCKEYFDDPARIVDDNHSAYTTMHLSESSRESLLGFITSIGPIASNDPLRLMTSGASYRLGSDWFDGDDKRISQTETVHAFVLNSSIEQYSLAEYEKVRDLLWSAYKKLELPLRLVHCSPDGMLMNEFDAHRVDVWLPSRQEWLQVARVSHYRDYLTIRAGMKRGHIIDSLVYDGQVLFAAIVENRQTALGKFILPAALGEHLTWLTQSEREHYLRKSTTPSEGAARLGASMWASSSPPTPLAARVLMNHEQRRYLVKGKSTMYHSKKSFAQFEAHSGRRNRNVMLLMIFFSGFLVDWDAFWCDTLSDPMRALLWDYVRVPAKRALYKLVCEPDNIPEVPLYDEIDKSRYELTRQERNKQMVDYIRQARPISPR